MSSPLANTLKNHSLPVQIEGFPYILGGMVLAIASALVWRALEAGGGSGVWAPATATVLFSVFTLFSIWFYRCPKVNTPADDPNAVISTADGTVLNVVEIPGTRIGEKAAKKISIFMSPFNVHVNRAPLAGVVDTIDYNKGKFWKADLDKASQENEHNWIVMRSDLGPKVAFAQIAGFVARRIVVYIEPGVRLGRGERYGMIRFGSRAEIMVPASAEVFVKAGDHTVAGETKLARLKA